MAKSSKPSRCENVRPPAERQSGEMSGRGTSSNLKQNYILCLLYWSSTRSNLKQEGPRKKHISACRRLSISCMLRCKIYPRVPTTCVVWGSVPWSYNLARPKSPNHPFSSPSSKTLLALTSQWTTTCSHSSCR